MSLVLLIAPFQHATVNDVRTLEKVKRSLVMEGRVPLFLPHAMAGVLDDENPDERPLALVLSRLFVTTLAQLPEVECLRIGDRITEGMEIDLQAWQDAGREEPRVV